MSTTTRYISSINEHYTTAELDSHADTVALGKRAYITTDTGHTVTVHPFTQGLKSINHVPVVTGALAYDCPTTLHTYILFFHQALHIERMDSHLICPGQLRANGVTVNDIPLGDLQPHERDSTSHSIIATGMHIPLKLEGTTSFFEVRTPTQEEIESNRDCIHVHMTNEYFWDPKDPSHGQVEEALRN